MNRCKKYIALVLSLSLLGTFNIYADNIGQEQEPDGTIQAESSDIVVSEAITVEGFQIRTQDTDSVGVSFRAVCKAPNVGSTIATVNGEEYKVKSMGTSYSIDMDGDNAIDVEDTYLNPQMKTATDDSGDEYGYFEGQNTQYTMGYIATSKGVISGWNPSDVNNTYYVRTMIKCDFSIATRYLIRGFVVAENDNGDEIIVYGKFVDEIVIAEVADYIYRNSLSSNYQGHMFLYDSILNIAADSLGNTNNYYRNQTLDYGWNDNLFTPEEPVTLCPTDFGTV